MTFENTYLKTKNKKMKKYLLSTLLFAISFASFSQEFLGIKVGGTTIDCVTKFRNKGFKYISKSDNVTEMKGVVNGTEMQLYIVETPLSKKVWKFTVYLPLKNNWYKLKADYNEYKTLLTEKYGTPSDEFEYFSTPYYEGDGYEISALKLEKCTYSTYWPFVNLEISKYCQIKISYEDPVNTALAQEEKDKQNKNTF